DAGLYKDRNTVERCINRLRNWRGIATRYDKTRDCKTFGVTPDHGRCIDDQQQRDRGRDRRAV
ncbi:hypothetical protein ACFVRE_39245, partial [Streptomyces sp. NPDC057910]